MMRIDLKLGSNAAATVVALAAGLATALAIAVLPQLPAPGDGATLQISSVAPPGSVATLSVNGEPSVSETLRPEMNGELALSAGHRPISSLSVSIVSPDGAPIMVGGMRLGYGAVQSVALDPAALAAVTPGSSVASGQPALSSPSGALTSVFTGAQPLTAPNVVGDLQRFVMGTADIPYSQWLAALLVALVGFCLAIGGLRGLLVAAVSGAVWVAGYFIYSSLPDLLNPPLDVSVAVGGASFAGTPYRGGQIAALLILLFLAAGSVLLASSVGRIRRKIVVLSVPQPLSASAIGWIALTVGLLAVAIAPTLGVGSGTGSTAVVEPSWDVANGLAWRRAMSDGLTPLRDFWYPYGIRGEGNLWPAGDVAIWIWRIIALAIVGASVRRFAAMSNARTVIALVAICFVAMTDFSNDVWSEMAGLALPIAYLALPPVSGTLRRSHAVMGFAAAFLLLLDPAIFLRGAAAVVALALVEVVAQLCADRRRWRAVLAALGLDVAVVAAGVVVVAIFWLLSGSFSGNVAFLWNLKDTGAYGAADQNVFGALKDLSLGFTTTSFELLAPLVLAAGGLVLVVVARSAEEATAARLMVAFAIYLSVNLLRVFIRPESATTLALIGLALLLSALICWQRVPVLRAIGVGIAAGALIAGPGLLSANTQGVLASAGAGPPRLVNSGLFLTHRGAIATTSEALLSPDRFPGWAEPVMLEKLRELSKQSLPDFATLGDAQLLYFLSSRPIPWQMNAYDGSPKPQQEKTIREIRRLGTRFLVWSRQFAQDGVPLQVRTPLMFRWAVANWVPKVVGPVACPLGAGPACVPADYLVARKPGQSIPSEYWISRLGTAVNLGFIPAYSAALSDQPCSAGPECVPVIEVLGPETSRGSAVKIQVGAGQSRFEVGFKTRPGVTRYPIPLDRLWFRDIVGSRPHLLPLSKGWSVRIVNRESAHRLY